MSLIFDLAGVFSTNLLFFSILWIFLFHFSRVSWLDVAWAASLGAWSLFHYFDSSTFGEKPALDLLAIAMLIWSLRLSVHLSCRLMRVRIEDRRYLELRDKAPDLWRRRSYFLFLVNALLVSALLLPQRILLWSSHTHLSAVAIAGFVICLISIAGESTADSQLQSFLKVNPGRTCQSGLWKYSRHPNYFFEWLFWVGVGLTGANLELGYLAFIPAVLMYVFLNYFTGISVSERDAMLRRPDFRSYKEKTSPFFPRFPRKKIDPDS